MLTADLCNRYLIRIETYVIDFRIVQNPLLNTSKEDVSSPLSRGRKVSTFDSAPEEVFGRKFGREGPSQASHSSGRPPPAACMSANMQDNPMEDEEGTSAAPSRPPRPSI